MYLINVFEFLTGSVDLDKEGNFGHSKVAGKDGPVIVLWLNQQW